jgi:hypothetical protein
MHVYIHTAPCSWSHMRHAEESSIWQHPYTHTITHSRSRTSFLKVAHQCSPCMYVCMYVCTLLHLDIQRSSCMYVCMYVCMFACMYTTTSYTKAHLVYPGGISSARHVCMYVCVYVCMYVHYYILHKISPRISRGDILDSYLHSQGRELQMTFFYVLGGQTV